jgi:hypothetical protein
MLALMILSMRLGNVISGRIIRKAGRSVYRSVSSKMMIMSLSSYTFGPILSLSATDNKKCRSRRILDTFQSQISGFMVQPI